MSPEAFPNYPHIQPFKTRIKYQQASSDLNLTLGNLWIYTLIWWREIIRLIWLFSDQLKKRLKMMINSSKLVCLINSSLF